MHAYFIRSNWRVTFTIGDRCPTAMVYWSAPFGILISIFSLPRFSRAQNGAKWRTHTTAPPSAPLQWSNSLPQRSEGRALLEEKRGTRRRGYSRSIDTRWTPICSRIILAVTEKYIILYILLATALVFCNLWLYRDLFLLPILRDFLIKITRYAIQRILVFKHLLGTTNHYSWSNDGRIVHYKRISPVALVI